MKKNKTTEEIIEKMIEQVSYSQFYEFPYNPTNKMLDVIGIQESGTKVIGKAFDIQGFFSKCLIQIIKEARREVIEKVDEKMKQWENNYQNWKTRIGSSDLTEATYKVEILSELLKELKV